MKAIWFGKHLYQPLLYLDTNGVQISPAPLNKGERQFVRCKACAPFPLALQVFEVGLRGPCSVSVMACPPFEWLKWLIYKRLRALNMHALCAPEVKANPTHPPKKTGIGKRLAEVLAVLERWASEGKEETK